MLYKRFSERLNKELDNIGAPALNLERIEIFSKLLKVPRFKAEALLNGELLPDHDLLMNLAKEFEVHPQWLLGQIADRKKYREE